VQFVSYINVMDTQASPIETDPSASSSRAGRDKYETPPAPPPTGAEAEEPASRTQSTTDIQNPTEGQKPGSSDDDDDEDYDDEEARMAQLEG